jgi:hypothetical protein
MKAPPATAGFFYSRRSAGITARKTRVQRSSLRFDVCLFLGIRRTVCLHFTNEGVSHGTSENNKPLWKVLVLVMAHIAVATLWFIGIGLGAYVLSVFVEWLTRETHVSRFVIKGLVGLENFVGVLDIILYVVDLLSSTYNKIKEFLKNENNDTGPGGDREE